MFLAFWAGLDRASPLVWFVSPHNTGLTRDTGVYIRNFLNFKFTAKAEISAWNLEPLWEQTWENEDFLLPKI